MHWRARKSCKFEINTATLDRIFRETSKISSNVEPFSFSLHLKANIERWKPKLVYGIKEYQTQLLANFDKSSRTQNKVRSCRQRTPNATVHVFFLTVIRRTHISCRIDSLLLSIYIQIFSWSARWGKSCRNKSRSCISWPLQIFSKYSNWADSLNHHQSCRIFKIFKWSCSFQSCRVICRKAHPWSKAVESMKQREYYWRNGAGSRSISYLKLAQYSLRSALKPRRWLCFAFSRCFDTTESGTPTARHAFR